MAASVETVSARLSKEQFSSTSSETETLLTEIKQGKLTPLFPVAELERIPYYDKHPDLGGTLSYLTHEAFQAKFGCYYSESMWMTEAVRTSIANEISEKDENILIKVNAYVKKNLSRLAICYIDDTVGHVLIATENMSPDDSPFLFFYSGILQHESAISQDDPYILHYSSKTPDLFVSSKKLGGLARFMPHLPLSPSYFTHEAMATFSEPQQTVHVSRRGTERIPVRLVSSRQPKPDRTKLEAEHAKLPDEWSTYRCDPSIEGKVAKANCTDLSLSWGPFVLNAIALKGRVEKGQILGISYREFYWNRMGQRPELLYKNGLVVPYDKYTTSYANRTMIRPTLKYIQKWFIATGTIQAIESRDSEIEIVIPNTPELLIPSTLLRDLQLGIVDEVEAAYIHLLSRPLTLGTIFMLQSLLAALILLKSRQSWIEEARDKITEWLGRWSKVLVSLTLREQAEDELLTLTSGPTLHTPQVSSTPLPGTLPSELSEVSTSPASASLEGKLVVEQPITIDQGIVEAIHFLLSQNCRDCRLLAPLLYQGRYALEALVVTALSDYADKKPDSAKRLSLVNKATAIACASRETRPHYGPLFSSPVTFASLTSVTELTTKTERVNSPG